MSTDKSIKLFLAGDVMIGRGIDQILPYPGEPSLYEPFVKDSRDYVALAEKINGKIPKPIDFSYLWGDALPKFKTLNAHFKIINLETTITLGNDHQKAKDIHYRMNPKNIFSLVSAAIDCCTLANNHLLDWGVKGLSETLSTLEKAGIKYAGAGENHKKAKLPAILPLPHRGRVIVLSYGHPSSGIPSSWSADKSKPGINFLPDFSQKSITEIKDIVNSIKEGGDIVVFSIHWGPNWGYEIDREQINFAHRLVDEAAVDVVFGHSSHHPKAFEVYKNKLILYSCGDFLNDYEGIGGYEEFRGDLTLAFFPEINLNDGSLISLTIVPFNIRRFRLHLAPRKDCLWLASTLNREGQLFGTRINLDQQNHLIFQKVF